MKEIKELETLFKQEPPPITDILKGIIELEEKGKLEYFAGDTYLDCFFDEVSKEHHYIYRIIMKDTNKERYYSMGICVRGAPSVKIFDQLPENAIASVWGKHGTYFNKE